MIAGAMWDFSPDEWFFFAAAAVVAVVGAVLWYMPLARVSTLGRATGVRMALAGVPVVCVVLLVVVLDKWADPVSVAGHPDYVTLFLVGGAAWLFATGVSCFPFLGISVRDDAVERGNTAAVVVACGAVVGITLAYAQSNIGTGPTIWTTLVPAFFATLGLFVTWIVAEVIGGIAEAVTVDRDVASAIRLAALLVASGAILGRAMAGDWTDWRSTFVDFAAQGWPAIALAVASGVAHRALRPTPQRPRPAVVPLGIIPAVILFVIAAGWLVYLGKPFVKPLLPELPSR
jgi:hypothetical protein